jgi:hypothetical protein
MFTCGMLGLCISQFAFEFGGDVSFIGVGAALYIMAAAAIALGFGGVDVINHCVLRLIVCRNGYVPKGLHRFLDHCTKLVFLRKVGGGYIFIHRLLLEHFAAMWEKEEEQRGAAGSVGSRSAVTAPT